MTLVLTLLLTRPASAADPERWADLLVGATASLTLDGAPIGPPLEAPWRRVPVLEHRDGAVLVEVTYDDARVRYWVGEAAVATWVARPAHGSAGPEGGAAGVELSPGLQVEPLESTGDRVQVRVEAGGIEATAWLHRSDLAPWRSRDESSWTPPSDAWLAPSTAVHDAPDGEVFARTLPTGQAPEGLHAGVLGAEGPWRLVEIVSSDRRIATRGWVAMDAVGPPPAPPGDTFFSRLPEGRTLVGIIGLSCCHSVEGWACPPHLDLPAGTVLFDAPGGRDVGTLDWPESIACTANDGRFALGAVASPWGTTPVWFERHCRGLRRWERRAAREATSRAT